MLISTYCKSYGMEYVYSRVRTIVCTWMKVCLLFGGIVRGSSRRCRNYGKKIMWEYIRQVCMNVRVRLCLYEWTRECACSSGTTADMAVAVCRFWRPILRNFNDFSIFRFTGFIDPTNRSHPIVSILYSQNSPFSNFRWRTQSCCNHHVAHCTEDHFMRLIVSDTIETGKPRINHPRWGHSVVSWFSAKKAIKCTRVCRTMLVESEQKWIVECIRGCPGAHRYLVRPFTFACIRSFVVTPALSCKNIHTHKDK